MEKTIYQTWIKEIYPYQAIIKDYKYTTKRFHKVTLVNGWVLCYSSKKSLIAQLEGIYDQVLREYYGGGTKK